MNIADGIKLDFNDVLIRPKRSETASRAQVNLERTFKTRNSQVEFSCVPIISANMDCTGTIAMAEVLSKYKVLTCLHKFYSEGVLIDFFSNNEARHHTFYTLGSKKEDFWKLIRVGAECKMDKICVDIANGYSQEFAQYCSTIRNHFPKAVLMVGNVVTPEMTHELLTVGCADIVKIGLGSGVQCRTRQVTGIGYPQLSAVIECSDAAHGLSGHICSDGGCKIPGDIAKAIGGGADFVMLGGMFAGCDECEGEWLFHEQDSIKKSLKFYGMSSKEAMDKYYGGISEYKASEGACTIIDAKGPVEDVIKNIMGGLRSTCSYCGTNDLKHLSKCTTFIKVNK